MNEEPMRMIQLHSYISEENDQKLHKLQLKYIDEKRIKINKSTIINQALTEYLDHKLDSLDNDACSKP